MPNLDPLSVAPTKPTSLFLKPISIDYGKFFKGILDIGRHLSSQNWISATGSAIDAASGLSISTIPEELAHNLLQRSLYRATFDVIGENNIRLLTTSKKTEISIPSEIEKHLSNFSISLDRKFFDRPTDIEIVTRLKESLEKWLILYGITAPSARNISNRFPTFFQAALISEWRRNNSTYQPILEIINSPFAKANEREIGWKAYNAHLLQQIERSIFDESFSLSQIYIPLNAFFLTNKINSLPNDNLVLESLKQRTVVALEEELLTWVNEYNQDDLLRVVSGGPGSGKSTFAKIFAAKASQIEGIRVLFFELHKLDATRDLPSEITRYVRDEGFLTIDPLDPDSPEPNLLIILDGLDELASQGRGSAETARAFINEVERTIYRKNNSRNKFRVLLSGRELIIQENESEFRHPRQILNLVPYHISEEEKAHPNFDDLYLDPHELLKKDLRQEWWRNYGELTGNKSIKRLPRELEVKGLDEITSQPLLNYLVALSYTRGKISFAQDVNLNTVYADLVEAVYDRGYDKKRRHISVSHLSLEEFQRALEEIALATWHGDGRSTTVQEIQDHCNLSNLGSLLDKFQQGASSGVTRLLAAFFFRQHGERSGTGDKTFVFTHKSFGEYLTSKRITRAIDRITKQVQIQKHSLDDGWSATDALEHWAIICGPSACTIYIKGFLDGEFRNYTPPRLYACRNVLVDLFTHILIKGMPMERVSTQSFFIATFHSRNAEETLLASLNSVSCALEETAYIPIPGNQLTSFGAWFRRIQGQRTGIASSLAAQCLSYLGLRNVYIDISDFFGANLSFSDLSGAKAHFTTFSESILVETNFHGAQLNWAVFDGAVLEDCNFTDAKMVGAYVDECDQDKSLFSDEQVRDMKKENIRSRSRRSLRHQKVKSED